jgi:hypothetical protein
MGLLAGVALLAGGTLLAQTKDKAAKKDEPGLSVTLIRVDAGKNVLVVTERGRRVEYKFDKDTKYIGPRGGLSDLGAKDDRLKVGAALRLVVGAGRVVREVHLPYRASDKDDAKPIPKKEAEKKEPEKKAPEKKAPEKKAAEKKAPEKKAAEKKPADKK